MVFVGFYNISNANQKDNLQLNQTGLGNNLFPVMGYAQIETNGQSIEGFVSRQEIGGEDISQGFIEFFTYRHELVKPLGGDTTRSIGRISASPIIITKRIDKATPILAQSILQNQVIEATFYFYDTSPEDGSTFQAFTMMITGGRISSLRTFTVLSGDISQVVEEVSFTYNTLTWTYVPTGVEAVYDWQGTGA